MAVVTECFSIREYTERMRSVDLRRCWPFGVEMGDTVSLPPISVRRFKWWTDEVDAGRSEAGVVEEDNLEKQSAELEISEGDGILAPEGNAVEVAAGLPEEEDAKRLVKGKQKTLKKRSIVELFAAVPLIAGAVDDIGEESGDVDSRDEECGGGGTDAVRAEEGEVDVAMRKKKGIIETDIKKKGGRKRRKKKGITGLKLDIRALEKKKTRKAKAVRKHKVLQTSKPFSKDAAKKLPVRSILKNHKKSTKKVSSKAADLIKLYCESNKHVTFSVDDDFPQMQNLCKIFSDVLAASTAINGSGKAFDPAKPPDVNSREIDGHKTELSSTDGKDQSTVINSSNSSCSGTEKASYAVMVDLNRSIEANDFDNFIPATSTLSSNCTCLADPTTRGTFEKSQNSTSETFFKAALPSQSESMLVSAQNEHFVTSSGALSSPAFEENERNCQLYVNAGIDFYGQSAHGLLSGSCCSMGSKKFGETFLAPDSVSACKSQFPGEDFIGLPLNSHGEFIQFHSGTKFSESYKKQNINLATNGRKRNPELSKKKVSSAQSYPKSYYSTKERVRHWLNFAELDGSKRVGIQRSQPTKSTERFIHDYRDGSDLQSSCNLDHHPQPSVQPTMRLMGKNVVLGGITSDCQTLNDAQTSKKNKNFVRQTRFSGFPEKPAPQPWMQRESAANFYNTDSLDPSFNHAHSLQPFWPPRSCENHIFDGEIDNHVLPPRSISNNSAQFFGNFISGEGSIRAEHHYPQILHQNIPASSSHRPHDRRLFHGELSRTKPQFKYQDFGNFSTEKLPPWLLNAKEQERIQTPDPHYARLLPKNSKKDATVIYPNFARFKSPAGMLGKRSSEFDDGPANYAKRFSKGKEAATGYQPTASAGGMYGSVARPSSVRFDNGPRPGPVKLIGGAKHILKPCQVVDDEHRGPVHSTIIFPGPASLSGAGKNLASIYKF